MLFRYKLETGNIPLALVVLCFMAFLMMHFLLRELIPWTSDLPHHSIITATDALERIPTEVSAGDFDDFKQALGVDRPLNEAKPKKAKTKTRPTPSEQKGSPAMYPENSDEEYLAICMAVKDQYLDLPEFMIHHYHHLRVRRFYIMDDGSEPPLSTYRDYGIPKEHITFHYYNRTTDHVLNMQDHVYNACVSLWRDRHTWMAFLDADEMLEVTGEESLTELLKRLEKNRSIGALAVNWQTHTSNGVLTRPESCRKAFIDCVWDGTPTHNQMYKSIVKTEFHAGHNHVHQAHLAGNTLTVGEDGINVPTAARNPITRNRIALHHYALKSREEYEAKINRSNAMDQPKDWSFWDSVEGMGGTPCPEMAMYDP